MMLGVAGIGVAGVQPHPPDTADSGIDAHRIRVHTLASPYQAEGTTIRVLPPRTLENRRQYPVIYVLPVEADNGSQYGDALLEAERLDLPERYRAIFAQPTFSKWPWYADHPTDPMIRQESHFLLRVVPFIEEHYPVLRQPKGRLLLGFSKSGWGAWSLLLRYPERFGRAAAWDAPLMMSWPTPFGSAEIFATQANFQEYRLENLVREHSNRLGPKPRLILAGYSLFRTEHRQMRALLRSLGIPHVYSDGPRRAHDWRGGWMTEVVHVLTSQP